MAAQPRRAESISFVPGTSSSAAAAADVGDDDGVTADLTIAERSLVSRSLSSATCRASCLRMPATDGVIHEKDCDVVGGD